MPIPTSSTVTAHPNPESRSAGAQKSGGAGERGSRRSLARPPSSRSVAPEARTLPAHSLTARNSSNCTPLSPEGPSTMTTACPVTTWSASMRTRLPTHSIVQPGFASRDSGWRSATSHHLSPGVSEESSNSAASAAIPRARSSSKAGLLDGIATSVAGLPIGHVSSARCPDWRTRTLRASTQPPIVSTGPASQQAVSASDAMTGMRHVRRVKCPERLRRDHTGTTLR